MKNIERLIKLDITVIEYYNMVLEFLDNYYMEELAEKYQSLLVYGTSIHGRTMEEIDYLCYFIESVNCWLDLEEFVNFHFPTFE